jgi:hypothetical protein
MHKFIFEKVKNMHIYIYFLYIINKKKYIQILFRILKHEQVEHGLGIIITFSVTNNFWVKNKKSKGRTPHSSMPPT